MKRKVFVISLPDHLERRDWMRRSMGLAGVEFVFFDAVDIRGAGRHEVNKIYSPQSSYGEGKRRLTNGEIGCAASHIEVCKLIVGGGIDYALILEDDAIIDFDVERLNSVSKLFLDSGSDVLILGYSKLRRVDADWFYVFEPIKARVKSLGFVLGEPWRQWTCGTVGYLVSNRGAKKIVDGALPIRVVADDWRYYESVFGLNILHCRPGLVFEDFERFDSAIQGERESALKKPRKYLDFLRVVRGIFRRIFLWVI